MMWPPIAPVLATPDREALWGIARVGPIPRRRFHLEANAVNPTGTGNDPAKLRRWPANIFWSEKWDGGPA
jgi:hypothetical protein